MKKYINNGVELGGSSGSGGSGGGTPFPEAPMDGKQYGRESGTWTEIVGGTDPFLDGVNYVSTVVDLPVDKQSVVATVGGDEALSLDGALEPGQVMNIKIVATADLKISYPSSPDWTYVYDTELVLKNGDIAEINIWCTDTDKYSVKTLDDGADASPLTVNSGISGFGLTTTADVPILQGGISFTDVSDKFSFNDNNNANSKNAFTYGDLFDGTVMPLKFRNGFGDKINTVRVAGNMKFQNQNWGPTTIAIIRVRQGTPTSEYLPISTVSSWDTNPNVVRLAVLNVNEQNNMAIRGGTPNGLDVWGERGLSTPRAQDGDTLHILIHTQVSGEILRSGSEIEVNCHSAELEVTGTAAPASSVDFSSLTTSQIKQLKNALNTNWPDRITLSLSSIAYELNYSKFKFTVNGTDEFTLEIGAGSELPYTEYYYPSTPLPWEIEVELVDLESSASQRAINAVRVFLESNYGMPNVSIPKGEKLTVGVMNWFKGIVPLRSNIRIIPESRTFPMPNPNPYNLMLNNTTSETAFLQINNMYTGGFRWDGSPVAVPTKGTGGGDMASIYIEVDRQSQTQPLMVELWAAGPSETLPSLTEQTLVQSYSLPFGVGGIDGAAFNMDESNDATRNYVLKMRY